MDLWIRSQNREKLIKVNNICLGYAEKLNMYYLGVFYDDLHMLGKYKTKERAMEILDEIQGILKPKGIIKLDGMYKPKDIERIREKYNSKHYFIADNEIETIQMPETIVYEMPEE